MACPERRQQAAQSGGGVAVGFVLGRGCRFLGGPVQGHAGDKSTNDAQNNQSNHGSFLCQNAAGYEYHQPQRSRPVTFVRSYQKAVKAGRLGMIPLDCHKWEADGFTYGATKYSPNNWRKGLPISEQMDSLLRHLNAFFNEYEDIDPESGVHHLGLAQCNLAMMVNTLENHPELDDRFKIKDDETD